MKKQVLFFLLMLTSMLAKAEKVLIDGIWFNLNPQECIAEVTWGSSKYASTYSGEIKIPEKVTYKQIDYAVSTIGEYAFHGDVNLSSVNIPNSVTSIGDNAFYGCTGLTSVILPNSIKTIGNEAFRGSSITAIDIPNSVISIGKYVFAYCLNLSSVTISNSVLTINDYTFSGCEKLLTVLIPESVMSIGDGAFERTGLTAIVLPDNVTSIGLSAFSGCSNLISVILGNGVKTIEGYAFHSCYKLTSITIPNNIISIGNYTFCRCTGITTINIGKNVTRVGEGAFNGCTSIVDCFCYGDKVPTAVYNAFNNSNVMNATLHVKDSLIEMYQNSTPWNYFKDIEKMSKCIKPTITLLANGKIKVESATEGATCVTNITASNAESLTDGEICLNTPLTVYTVTAYTTKEGYDDSEVATATFRYEETEGDMNGDGQVNVSDVVQLVNTILSK
ncbi:MAG: leucine-rich repeat domain-containing protein [Prevotella sp.]|nr:leucine-rich repeat domain-containing protein [Prevotella sp.]